MNAEAVIAALTIPGLPAWTGLAAALALALLALCLLVMPFSVFGLKSRLETIEAQLDELQADLRAISARLADAPRRSVMMDDLEMPSPPRAAERNAANPAPRDRPGARNEPRINWPRDPR
jgi:hypothetical protein